MKGGETRRRKEERKEGGRDWNLPEGTKRRGKQGGNEGLTEGEKGPL